MGFQLARWASDGVPVFFVIVLVVALLTAVWQIGAGPRMLERWAQANGFRLLEAEYRWLARGPFWWRTGKNQSVYRIRVQDAAGEVYAGWARCGGWFLGMLSDHVDVEWDDPTRHQEPPGFPVVMPGDRRPPEV